MTKCDLALGTDHDSPPKVLSPCEAGRQCTHVMFQLEPLVSPTNLFAQATLVRHCSPQSEVRIDGDQGMMTGKFGSQRWKP